MAFWSQSLQKTRERFSQALQKIFFASAPDDITQEELHDLLITADVPPSLADQLIQSLKTACRPPETRQSAFQKVLIQALDPIPALDWAALPIPSVILLVGINGSGKTTTAAKLAHMALRHGRSPLLGATDTFRAAGAHQLKLWADRIGCESVIGAPGGDAAAVAYDALDAAIARRRDLVIVDTAGRMHTKEPLLRELQKIRSALAKRELGAPHLTFLVLDAMLGQNAVAQARQFLEMIPLDGAIVTKLDGSSKGGFLFAIRRELNLPIYFAGLGEGMEDLVPFDSTAFVRALLGNSPEP